MKLQMYSRTTYPAQRKSNWKSMAEAVSARGFTVKAEWPILWIGSTDYQWPDGLERMREIISMYPRRDK